MRSFGMPQHAHVISHDDSDDEVVTWLVVVAHWWGAVVPLLSLRRVCRCMARGQAGTRIHIKRKQTLPPPRRPGGLPQST